MNSISKRKKIELLLVLPFAFLVYFFASDLNSIVLFLFGYIWNWVNSIELNEIYNEKRYRFSLIRFIRSIQSIILKPFRRFPSIIQKVIGIFPAGVFWFLVIYIYESQVPWWAPFLGSLIFEIVSFEVSMFQNKDRR